MKHFDQVLYRDVCITGSKIYRSTTYEHKTALQFYGEPDCSIINYLGI